MLLRTRRLKITAVRFPTEDRVRFYTARSTCGIEGRHRAHSSIKPPSLASSAKTWFCREPLFTVEVRAAATKATADLFSGVFIRPVGKALYFFFLFGSTRRMFMYPFSERMRYFKSPRRVETKRRRRTLMLAFPDWVDLRQAALISSNVFVVSRKLVNHLSQIKNQKPEVPRLLSDPLQRSKNERSLLPLIRSASTQKCSHIFRDKAEVGQCEDVTRMPLRIPLTR